MTTDMATEVVAEERKSELLPTPTDDALPRRLADFATLGEALDYAAQGVRVVLVVHDLMVWETPQWTAGRDPRDYARNMLAVIAEASALVAVSQHTAQAIRRALAEGGRPAPAIRVAHPSGLSSRTLPFGGPPAGFDARRPFVVSNLRLAVHQLKNRAGPQRNDPGNNTPISGYAGHYCSAPRQVNPGIVACSMIGSGLRIFDVRKPYHPREVGYFNRVTYPNTKPNGAGGMAFSAPGWDLKRRLVYYSDGLKGLYAVRLAKSIVPRHYWD